MSSTLYYVHDPMCSWCWGFKSTMDTLESTLPPDVSVVRVLGGLAPDSDEPMPAAMQNMLQQTWQQIASVVPGTKFNMDFWSSNKPRRSTWPSCRAVLAAKQQSTSFELPMIRAIQEAYYLNAKNPSDIDVLTELAKSVGCDADVFQQSINSDVTRNELQSDMQFGRQLGAQGFPSLILKANNEQYYAVQVDYNRATAILDQIEKTNLS